VLIDIHLIFGTLFCHTKLQIKFKFGFYPFEFHKVMAHGLIKILRILDLYITIMHCGGSWGQVRSGVKLRDAGKNEMGK
jgi:hypothetical protein